MNLGLDHRIIIGIILGFANGLIFGAAIRDWYIDLRIKQRTNAAISNLIKG